MNNIYIYSRNTRFRRDFPLPPGEWRLRRPMFRAPSASLLGGACDAHSFKKLPQGHEDSEYVLSFEIGQRESGFYSERTNRQSDRTIQFRITSIAHRIKNPLRRTSEHITLHDLKH